MYVNSSMVRVVTFMRHMGTRSLWLTALSLVSHTLVEDDVVLLPGRTILLLGACYHAPQPLSCTVFCPGQIARLSAGTHRLRLSPVDPTLPTSWLARLHAFLMRTRASSAISSGADCELIISDLRSTVVEKLPREEQGAGEHVDAGMIAFAFHNNRTTLYPRESVRTPLLCRTRER